MIRRFTIALAPGHTCQRARYCANAATRDEVRRAAADCGTGAGRRGPGSGPRGPCSAPSGRDR